MPSISKFLISPLSVCVGPPAAVHAEEEPSLQCAEGGDGVVHGEVQHVRQREVQGRQGPA